VIKTQKWMIFPQIAMLLKMNNQVILNKFLFELIRYTTMAYNALWSYGITFYRWYMEIPMYTPVTRYFLSDDHEFDDSYERVPEDAVYVEEWISEQNVKKCVVLYEGETIPKEWTTTPFDKEAKCPWIWVGDRDTEIDLTRTFNKFLVPGNKIQLDLVSKLIQITEKTNLVYIESGSFKEIKFPGDGILIKANGEGNE
jgi:hypothetical protein